MSTESLKISTFKDVLEHQADFEICELLLLRCKCGRIFDSTEGIENTPTGLIFEVVIP